MPVTFGCSLRSVAAVAARLAAVSGIMLTSLAVSAAPIDTMPGRWSGWGVVTLTNDVKEQVKCVATYFLENSGQRIEQNLRCASADYKIDARAVYNVAGTAVSGTWEERTHSNKGNVQGVMTGDGFKLAITGDTFTARMVMTASECKQSINIVPTGLNVSQVTIGLKKC